MSIARQYTNQTVVSPFKNMDRFRGVKSLYEQKKDDKEEYLKFKDIKQYYARHETYVRLQQLLNGIVQK
ncbi:hypothetical protein pb186bvf_012569 [Paramecium bursaria]